MTLTNEMNFMDYLSSNLQNMYVATIIAGILLNYNYYNYMGKAKLEF